MRLEEINKELIAIGKQFATDSEEFYKREADNQADRTFNLGKSSGLLMASVAVCDLIEKLKKQDSCAT